MEHNRQSDEVIQSLPPRRDRHGSSRSKKLEVSMRVKAETTSNKNKRRTIAVQVGQGIEGTRVLKETPEETLVKRKKEGRNHKKKEPKGSLIFANSVMWGFLLFVGFLIFYTIRHYS